MPLYRWRQRSFFTRQDFLFRHFAILVAFVYAAVSIAWIALSDRLVAAWAGSLGLYEEIQTLKGWFFVLASAFLIYYVLDKAWEGIVAAFENAAQSEERLNLALSCAGGGIWELDLVGEQSSLVHISPELMERLDLPPGEEVTHDTFRARRHPDDSPRADAELRQALEPGGKGMIDLRYRLRTGGNDYRWVHMRGSVIRDAAGRAHRLVGVAIDIDRMMKAQEEVERIKRFDPATGLAKRGEFLSVLSGFGDSEGWGGMLGLAVIRLSGSARREDEAETGGEPAMIRLFAERLRALPDMVAARLSNDLFALAPSRLLSRRETQHGLEEAVQMLMRPLELTGETVRLRAQIGGAIGSLSGEGAGELLRSASQVLERAELRGDAVIFWSDERLNEEFDLRSARLRSLEHAVENGEIQCYFQPLVDLRTGQTAGFEALARWNRTEEGLVSPDKFIGLAEEVGLIGEIGEEILKQACAAAAAWPNPALFVAVNVSPLQLDDLNFPDIVRQVLSDTGLSPARLELEITESALPRDPDIAAQRISDLRALGVQIAIDDFGTGYSNFGLLSKLPFSRLKIDRSFVDSCLEKQDAMILVDAMADLCKSLKLSVTAEGVETVAQAKALAAKGVDIAQGYLFSRPVKLAEAASLANRRWSEMLGDGDATSCQPGEKVMAG